MPTLAAVLMVAAVSSVRLGAIDTIWRTALTSRIAFAATLLATLFLSVTEAVAVGVVISLLLQLNREALDLTVVELVPREDGRLEERPAPSHLAVARGDDARRVRQPVLRGRAHAGGSPARTPRAPTRPVVIVRLRGRTALGATSFVILDDYADRLDEAGGRLYLSGVDPVPARPAPAGSAGRRRRTGTRVRRVRGDRDSSGRAYADAEKWLRSAENIR